MTASPPEARTGPPLARRIAAALPSGETPALSDAGRSVALATLASTNLVDDADRLSGRTVMIRTRAPLAAAIALATLDGVASRLVLCPPDVEGERLAQAAMIAGAEAVASDTAEPAPEGLPLHRIGFAGATSRIGRAGVQEASTDWALFTSGTSGAPKMVLHDLDRLTGAIVQAGAAPPTVWATFYDIRRYGGLQMLLRALAGGFSLHIADPEEPLADFLARLKRAGVTHLAGTPSHWRRALMSPALAGVEPRYVRLSGEIADQAVLDALRLRFPNARIGHAYASTEAGVGFEVTDGLAGFPAALLEDVDPPVQIQVTDGTLRLRSPRAAQRYLSDLPPELCDADGFVDTGDLVERRGERFHFLGRRSGIINVGGLKISPEEVEAVINACPRVRMSRVLGRRSPLVGALVAAEVVLEPGADPSAAKADILARCREALAPYKTPALIRIVERLEVGAAGKLERRLA